LNFESGISDLRSEIFLDLKFENEMPINEADVKKIAQLAHLEISSEELLIFAPQIAEIVNYIEQLSEVDTSNIEPATGGLTPEGELTDSSRADTVVPSLGQKLALAEAPDAASNHFRVPKIL
jgi:aspartyl-tRNA(Asn)/glutamyl-tRNA(Gln) amidotransferase subunit C